MTDIPEQFQNLKVRGKKDKLKIGVIAGGISSEREVSLVTGENIHRSLLKSGYNAVFIDPGNDFLPELKKINLAFLALHGRYGEDGTIQGLLEFMKIPYTGAGVLGSAIAINKLLSKKIMSCDNILTPDYVALNYATCKDIEEVKSMIDGRLSFPLIVKPNSEGSTIGVNIADNYRQLESALKSASEYDNKILIEKCISGREFTVSIIGRKPVVLPIIEIRPKKGFYDYKNKYVKNMTEYIVPARLDKEIYKKISNTAVRCHSILECSSISRVDFILDENDNAYVFELNTMPGMTETSLVPKAAGAAGINFDHLIEIILDMANLKV
ncbi:MAG: D-alanine--D-alanine ligase [Actinomycetota bacterium]|nr:D-alanine--D-alanine ligase [Actinomycetota bacterium]